MPYSKNGGDRRPRFWQDRASYRFLPPFFFPPLAVFFAIALIPPFVWDSFARSTLRIAAPLPAGTRRCVNTPLVASYWAEGLRPSDSPTRALARRFAGSLRSRGSFAALTRVVTACLAL